MIDSISDVKQEFLHYSVRSMAIILGPFYFSWANRDTHFSTLIEARDTRLFEPEKKCVTYKTNFIVGSLGQKFAGGN